MGPVMTELDFPQYSPSERLADGVVHVLSISAAATGAVVLILLSAGSLSPGAMVGVIIYCIGLLAVFCVSAAYHLTGVSPLKAMLRRFDQATIFFKIASTYTPFMAIKLAGWTGAGFLALVWSVATFGMTTKLFFPYRLTRVSYFLYLALGWCVVLILVPLFDVLTARTLLLLLIGGLLYTIGVVFHVWENLRFQNAIWHGFVLGGAGFHYAAVLDSVLLA